MQTGKLPVSKTIIAGNLLWLALGILSVTYITYAFNPPTDIMGVSNSPFRISYWYIYVLGVEVALSVYLIYLFTRNESFRAPPGRFVPGRHYSLFSSYNLAAMGIIAALYAAGGLFGAVTNFDIVAAVTAFGASFFGPFVPFVAIVVGAFVRFATTGLSFINPAAVPAFAFSDASRWAIAGYFMFRFVRASGSGVMSYAKWVAILPLVLLVHFLSIVMSMFSVNPWSAFVGGVGFMVYWYPTSVISIVVGLIVAEAAYRSVSRRRMTSMPAAQGTQS